MNYVEEPARLMTKDEVWAIFDSLHSFWTTHDHKHIWPDYLPIKRCLLCGRPGGTGQYA